MLKKVVLCGLAMLLGGIPARAAENLPWLRAEGVKIVNEAGQPVVLGGVNLGGWLVEEMWMLPYETKPPEGSGFKEIKDPVTLWGTVEKRFGAADMARVRTAWRNAWITEADFDRIRAAKMNCVRLPFLYDLLDEPDGWTWLDKALDWARARGLYVVLDLHGAPGRQSNDHHTGEAGVNRLFKDPAMVAQTEAVWTKVAQRYKDRPEVAGYDLLNEPMGAPDNATLYLVQDRLYRAIRAVDARHLIIVEDGYKGSQNMPYPAIVGWQNVVLSVHHYNFNAKSREEQAKGLIDKMAEVAKIQQSRPVPFYLGEFQIEPWSSQEALATGLKAFEQGGLSWAAWTYKSAFKGGGGGMWGWYRAPHALQPLDPFRDAVAELIQKTEQVRTEKLQEDTGMTEAFKGRLP